jgi:hypothetical protein
LNQADLEELLGPIALYPDQLLANVLASSVYPNELKAAGTFIEGGGDAAKIADQGWEASVQAIAKIPDVLKFLNDSMDWTEAVGQAYIVQSTDVMKAIQALRAKAKSSGALQNSQQQTVIEDGSTIVIQPADPEVIYVPQYNPQVVYAPPPPGPSSGDVAAAGIIGFGVGLAIGACFNDDCDCDWHGGCIGYGWGGHNDVDIDRDVNIETGDININSGNTVKGGDRTNVQGGNKTNVQGGNKNNTMGREGTKWQPNTQKVDTKSIQQGGASKLNSFKGASTDKSRSSRVPTQTMAKSSRSSPAAVSGDRNRSADNRGGANAPRGNDALAANNGARGNDAGRAGSSARPAAGGDASKARAPAPKPKTAAPSVGGSGPGADKPSAFSPDRGSSKAASRGASSRSGGGGGGGGRGGGGGGRRG